MSDTEVIETEKVEETVETETPSPSEATETQTEETQAEETGEQTETGEETVEKGEETETPGETEEEKGKKREAYLKRQLEKKDKELAEAKAQAEISPTRQQEILRQKQEEHQQEVKEYTETLGISDEQAEFLIKKQEEKAKRIAASNVQPYMATMHRTQFDTIRKDLATDPDIVDIKSLEKEVEAIARDYEMQGKSVYLGNKEVVKNIYLHVQAKHTKDLIKQAREQGRQDALKDKRIESEVGMPKTAVSAGGTTGGITKADKEFAAKQNVTVERAREIRIKREKAIKDAQKQA